jgi:hypothetical protein
MATLIDRLGSDRLRQWLPLATLIILVALIGSLQPVFLQPSTLLELAGDTAVLFVLATGVTFVIMLGGCEHVTAEVDRGRTGRPHSHTFDPSHRTPSRRSGPGFGGATAFG